MVSAPFIAAVIAPTANPVTRERHPAATEPAPPRYLDGT
jgi:hypothetical protein